MKCIRTLINNFTTKALTKSDSEKYLEISEVNFSFAVSNINRLKTEVESVVSPPAYVRHLPWNIALNYNENGHDSALGVFLSCNYNKNNSWSCTADVEIKLLSFKSHIVPYTKKFTHSFDIIKNVKGYDQFIKWSELICPKNGYAENDEVTIEVLIKCSEPIGVSWNSRKHTGFVGLECKIENSFLNSLTQILYGLDQFRTSIIDFTIENDEQNHRRKLICAMQEVFNQLQSSKTPVSIDELIKSIGHRYCYTYDTDSFFNFVRKRIEKESLTKQVSEIFHGQMSILSTHSGKLEVTKLRNFYSIDFKVSDDMNIYELLDSYFAMNNPLQCREESDSSTLRGSSWTASTLHQCFYSMLTCTNPFSNPFNNNIQPSVVTIERRVEITKLPAVLIVHLNRPVIDIDTANMDPRPPRQIKFEFHKKINLKRYVRKSIDSSTNYLLHAVLVRYICGAFSAFINLQRKDNNGWLKFDNAIVSHISETEAIDDNFSYVQMLIYTHQSNEDQVKDENVMKFTCIICLETTKNTEQFSTICGHLFCGPCIKKEISLRQTCPVCKNELAERDIHQIYV